MGKMKFGFLISMILILNYSEVESAPIQWEVGSGGNGNYYEYVEIGKNWYDAKADAESRVYLQHPGHLVTVTSQAEQDFVVPFISESGGSWLGLFQDLDAPEYSEPAGGWRWVTDEPFVFTLWLPGEPNHDIGLPENVALFSFAPDWLWNDNEAEGTNYFIVEYESSQFVTPEVPEPSTIALLLTGGVGLVCYGWRRKKTLAV